MPHKKSHGKVKKAQNIPSSHWIVVGSRSRWRQMAEKLMLGTQSDKWKCHSKVKHGFEAALLYFVLHMRWVHIYLARLSWWLSWLGSCTRLLHGSPGPRLCRWRLLEWEGRCRRWGGEEEREEVRQGKGKKSRRRRRREDDILVNGHVHNTQN